jgi:hypothetical protein
MKNVTAKFISVMCSGFTTDPDNSEIGLGTLEALMSQLPPYVFGQVYPDDMTDVKDL